MKLKFNWGTGIAIFYSSFVLILVSFVIFTGFHKVDLVDDNYYEEELKYQNIIDKKLRSNNLIEKLLIETGDNYIKFKYPNLFKPEQITGSITFFRPSDKTKDFMIPVKAGLDGSQLVGKSKLEKGMWRIKVDWAVGDSTYYNEELLFI